MVEWRAAPGAIRPPVANLLCNETKQLKVPPLRGNLRGSAEGVGRNRRTGLLYAVSANPIMRPCVGRLELSAVREAHPHRAAAHPPPNRGRVVMLVMDGGVARRSGCDQAPSRKSPLQ